VALRFSLGATRWRLVRQALTESLLLAASGAALGILLGVWGTRLLIRFLPEQAGDPLSAWPDGAVLIFTLAASIFSALLFGLVPALRSTAILTSARLRSETGGASGTPLLRRALVVAQVAFSAVLVVMASLFGHSLFELRSVDLGFRNQNVIAFNLDLPRDRRSRDVLEPYRRLAAQLDALPGIRSVSYGFPGPFQMGVSSAMVRVPGSERTALEPADVATAQVAPRYFETIGTAVVVGREFSAGDIVESRDVAIVNEAFVRAFLSGEPHPDQRYLSFDKERTSIIGVVRDVRQDGIQKAPKPTIYVPAGSNINRGGPTMLVRTALPPMALLRTVYRETLNLGPSVVVQNFATLAQRVDDSIFEQRLLATLSGFFGVLALVLAAVGLYGVVAYGTAGRTAEIGVRIAIGARRGQVVWMILRGSLGLVSMGLAFGLIASAAAAKAVASILFGILPSDPTAFGFTAAALAITGLAAAFVPARRAASIDPMRALRHE
jgi:predicted permease